MAQIDFIKQVHSSTERNYLERVVEHNKPQCARIAKKFSRGYWDGDRKYGYGGFRYDGRWRKVAKELARHYKLKAGMKVLDVGCGKGFLLYDLMQEVPGLKCQGVDISAYAISHTEKGIKPLLKQGLAQKLPFAKNTFDLVISINTLHNLYIFDLQKALSEINRVMKKNAYLVVESYRNEKEKANLIYWQLTCECFFTPQEWKWIYQQFGYKGDYSFIYFE